MLTAEAHVETERATRHLVQFCRHASHMVQRQPDQASGHGSGHRRRDHGSGHRSPVMPSLEWSDTYAVVTFGWGRCSLQATPRTLELRAEAVDEQGLRRIQEGVSGRLETIGSSDHLQVTWEAPLVLTSVQGGGAAASEVTDKAPERRGPVRTALVVMAGVLVVLLHLVAGPAVLLGAVLGALGLGGKLGKGFPTEAIGLGATFVVLLVLLKLAGMVVNVLILRRLGRPFLQNPPQWAARMLRWVIG